MGIVRIGADIGVAAVAAGKRFLAKPYEAQSPTHRVVSDVAARLAAQGSSCGKHHPRRRPGIARPLDVPAELRRQGTDDGHPQRRCDSHMAVTG